MGIVSKGAMGWLWATAVPRPLPPHPVKTNPVINKNISHKENSRFMGLPLTGIVQLPESTPQPETVQDRCFQ